MSRMPPIPSASQPAYGPGGVPKDFVTDLSHHTDSPFDHGQAEAPQDSAAAWREAERSTIKPPVAGDDLGGAVPARGSRSEPWALIALGAVVAAIVWLAGRTRRAS